ncbi:vitellogenin receptor Yl isoform X6 [Hydra vulgaris]|uniref:Vitellogenin receptor Yl isoform X6 n=1 Tax=Hydra vulgaris TaxID=6087 RepID=A0ABM4BM83_HYDVU
MLLKFLILFWSNFNGLFGENPDKPCLYVATASCILRMSIDKENGSVIDIAEFVTPVSAGVQIRALELDVENGDLYWGNLFNNAIFKLSFNGNVEKKLFSYAIGYITGLAVDSTSHMLYWVDNLMKLIEASTTEGLYRKVLFKLNRDSEARAIALHPAYGYLFWTDWGVTAKIERASCSGTNRVTLVSNDIVWPNDITIDYNTNVLYWVDAYLDVLSAIDINGGNRKKILQLKYKLFPHPFSLVYFNNKIYVSDWTDDSIYLISSNGLSRKIFQLPDTLKNYSNSNIGQMKVYAKRAAVYSPCSSITNCSHLCFTTSTITFSCGCPVGLILSSDNYTCVNVQKHFEIFFTDSGMNSIYQLVKYVDQDGFTIKPLVIPGMEGMIQYPVAINYDQDYLYWTDTKSYKTYRMSMNGSDLEIVINHVNHSSIGLAVDHISKLMFFFDHSDDGHLNLVVSDLKGKNVKTLVSNIINPQDVVYYDGYIFYSDLGSHLIGRINSDGTELITLMNPSNYPLSPTGLAVDIVERRLYWCDQYSNLIESSDLNFSQRRKIIQKTIFFQNRFWLANNLGEVLDPFDLIVHHERIYWTDLQKQAIFVADKRSGSNIEYVTGGLSQPMRMLITGDIPHEEFRKVYLFSFTTNPINPQYSKCFRQSSCNSEQQLPVPDLCPPGYQETNYGYSCSNCSDAFGANFKCLCSDWMTCAQRGYANIFGCHPERPFIEFKVRECTQVVKFGICPYKTLWECSSDMQSCLSDRDCNDSSKCCQSACGSKCVPYLIKSDHPCTVNNGGCSHICFSSTRWLKCGCPDGMKLMENGKECQNVSKTLTSSVQSIMLIQSVDVISFLPKISVKPSFTNLVATSSMFVTTIILSTRSIGFSDLSNQSFKSDFTVISTFMFSKQIVNSVPLHYSSAMLSNTKDSLKPSLMDPLKTSSLMEPLKTSSLKEPLKTSSLKDSLETSSFDAKCSLVDLIPFVSTINLDSLTTSIVVPAVSSSIECCLTMNANCCSMVVSVAATELCQGILCNNGGSCNVLNKTAKCLCADNWFGSSCQIYTKSELISISLQTTKEITKEYLVTSLASYYSQYCSDYKNNCVYDALKRRRRSIFNQEDIYILQFEYKNNYLSFDFAIVSETNGVLKKESIKAGLNGFIGSLDSSFQAKLVSANYLESSVKKSNSTLVGALICLFIIITILILLFAFLRYKKRPVRHAVQWSLQNQIFIDAYPHEASLPNESFPSSLGYTNPMYAENNCEKNLDKNMINDNVVLQENDVKKQTQQWVQFTNDDEILEKTPIKDFVSPFDEYQTENLNQSEFTSSPPVISTFQRSCSVNNDFFNDRSVLHTQLSSVSLTQLSDDYVVLTRPASSRLIEIRPLDDSISKEELHSDC